MINNPEDRSDLTESLRGLLKIATVLRNRRNDQGALTLASPEIKFKLDVDREKAQRKGGVRVRGSLSRTWVRDLSRIIQDLR